MNKFLIIGGGSIGRRHLRNLLFLGAKDITVVEVNQESRQKIATEFGVTVFASIDEAWAVGKFNIAIICSPSVYHLEQSLAAAKQGCHLFIEKPLATSLKGLTELETIVRQKNLITLIGSNWKFYPLFQKMKDLITTGAIGQIMAARCEFGQYLPDWHPWEDYRQGYSANQNLGGGILLDSHEFEYLTWFLGDVKRLSCFATKVSNLEIDVEDVAETILEFKNGAIGEIHLDYFQRSYQRNFEFFGATGTIIWDANAKRIDLKGPDHSESHFPLPENYDFNEMYIAEMKHFLNCLESQTQTITPLSQAIKTITLIMAAKQSAAESKVINL